MARVVATFKVYKKLVREIWGVVDWLRAIGLEIDAERAIRAVNNKLKIKEMIRAEEIVWAVVENKEKKKKYEVRIDTENKYFWCSCEDHKFRKTICKHILFVLFRSLRDGDKKSLTENVDKELEEEVKAFYGW